MKEVKFRAFFKKISNNEIIMQFAQMTKEWTINTQKEMFDNGYIQASDWEQYINYKDETGKEIYEGDIIKGNLFNHKLPTMGTVVYDNFFCFYANQNDAGNTPLHAIDKIEIKTED